MSILQRLPADKVTPCVRHPFFHALHEGCLGLTGQRLYTHCRHPASNLLINELHIPFCTPTDTKALKNTAAYRRRNTHAPKLACTKMNSYPTQVSHPGP